MDSKELIKEISQDWKAVFKTDKWDDKVCSYFLTDVLDNSISSVTSKDVKGVRRLLTDWKRIIETADNMQLENLPKAVSECLRKEGFSAVPDIFKTGYISSELRNSIMEFRKQTGRTLDFLSRRGDFIISVVRDQKYTGSNHMLDLSFSNPFETLMKIKRPLVFATAYTIKNKRGNNIDLLSSVFVKDRYTNLMEGKLKEVLSPDELNTLSQKLVNSNQIIEVLSDSDINLIKEGKDVGLPCGDVLHIGRKGDKRLFSIDENKKAKVSSFSLISGVISKMKDVFLPESVVNPAPIKNDDLEMDDEDLLDVTRNDGKGWGSIYDSPFSDPFEYKDAVEKALGVNIPEMNDKLTEASTSLFREWYSIIDDAESVRCLPPTDDDYFWKGQGYFEYSDKVFDETLKERFIVAIQHFEMETGLCPDYTKAVQREPGTMYRCDMALNDALKDYVSVRENSKILTPSEIEGTARERIRKKGMAFLNKTTRASVESARNILSGKMLRELKNTLSSQNLSLKDISVSDLIALKQGKSVQLETGQCLSRIKTAGGFGVRLYGSAKTNDLSSESEM